MKRVIDNCRGFSIIEVLIGACIFMIGFSTLVLMLNSVLVKFSLKELQIANSLCQQTIIETMTTEDTTSFDSTLTYMGLRFDVNKNVEIECGLARVSVRVTRENSNKSIVEIYSEFTTTQKH